MPKNSLKYVFTLAVVLCITVTAVAQQLAVESFTIDEQDQTARITNPRKDQNNKTYAIVKMETALLLQDFTFEAGSVGVAHTEQKTGEIWVYLSPGARRLTISHKYLGTIRNHEFGEALREATVYIMKLKSGSVKTVIEESVNLQYFEVACAIDGATIHIDGADPESFTSEKFSKLLSYGKHQYTIEAPLYHPLHGITEITAKKQPPLQAALQPAFGKIVVNTQPEQGADVFVNDEKRGQSPLTLDKMRSGDHTVRVVKTLYLPANETTTVSDGQTTTLNLAMKPNFAAITFNADGNIYVNDEFKASGTWNGRLTPGVYKIEARKPSHRASLTTIEAKAGETRTVTLDAPVPIYGSLNITANVPAQIYVDNKATGETTPYMMNKVLVGNRSIELRADGYESYKQTVEIQEGKITNIQPVLQKMADARTTPGCATSTIDLGKVGFVSSQTWKFGDQIWSAPVTATYCNKTSFDGDGSGSYKADCCKHTEEKYGNLFSWCMVTNYSAQLCPSPWRIPTRSDFDKLTRHTTGRVLTKQWGFGGLANSSSLNDVSSSAYYWSSTEYGTNLAYSLAFDTNGYVYPQNGSYKRNGFQVRCVK